MLMMKVFLNRMLTVFLDCVSPDSRLAKPKCMMNTRAAAIIIHRLCAVNRAKPGDAANAA